MELSLRRYFISSFLGFWSLCLISNSQILESYEVLWCSKMVEQSLMSFVFEQAMGHIHAIQRDGTVLTGVAVGSLLLSPTLFLSMTKWNKCGWWEAQGYRAALWTNPGFELGLGPGGWVWENSSLIHLWSAVDIHYYTFLVLSCIKWGVSVDLCQLFLMHNQSIRQSQYVSLAIQMFVSSLLFQRFWLVSITFWSWHTRACGWPGLCRLSGHCMRK